MLNTTNNNKHKIYFLEWVKIKFRYYALYYSKLQFKITQQTMKKGNLTKKQLTDANIYMNHLSKKGGGVKQILQLNFT